MTNQTPPDQTVEDLCKFVRKAQAAQDAVNEQVRAATSGGKFADAQHPQGFPANPGPKWFITFGLGTPNGNQYALMKAQEYGNARDEAFARYGRAWAFMYDISDLQTQIAQYGMTERAD